MPRSGAFPFADSPNPSNVMAVQGPLASTMDLADWLGSQGARVGEASPAFDWRAHFGDYMRLLIAQMTIDQSAERRAAEAARLRALGTEDASTTADGLTLDYAAFASLLERRARLRAAWAAFFRDWDLLVTPAFPTTAFPHRTPDEQAVVIDGREVPYLSQVFYPQVAILCGLPATAFPAGFDASGLPIGLQAVGPHLEDRTPLRFAQLLEREWRAFTPPSGYA